MARPDDDDEAEKPLDPAVERVRRKLVRFVAINLGLLFLALMAVAVAIVYKARNAPPADNAAMPAPADVARGDIRLPAGATIMSQSLSGSRIAFDLKLAESGRAIVIYDTSADRIVGRFDIAFE